MYGHVAHRLSAGTLEEMFRDMFGLNITNPEILMFKSLLARFYRPTYKALLARILKGPVVHADETYVKLRTELLDYQTYEEIRPAFREEVMAAKAARRIHVGPHVTFLFENTLTIRYQIQEMIRVERIVREAAVRHEIDTFNELLGGVGELGCTLLIEIDDAAERAVKLRAWLDLPEHLYLVLADGRRVRPRVDERQRDGERISSVHYLKFDVGGQEPVAAGCDLPGLVLETPLTDEQRRALAEDLGPDPLR